MSETHAARADRRATGRARTGDLGARLATPSAHARQASLAAAALKASEEQYRRFVEDDIAGVFITTPAGAITLGNPAFAAMFGFDSVEDALAVDMSTLYETPGDRGEVLAALQADGRIDRREIRLRHRDGTIVHAVLTAIGEFDDDGRLVRIRGYLLDITERRRLEEQLRQAQKMEAIGRLAGGIAHDFNNLLTAINGYASMLGESLAEDDPRRADTDEIRRAGDRAAQLTRQLLAFSRRQVLQPAVLDVNGIIAGLAPMLGRLIGEHIELRIVPAADLGHVQADPAQLEQVILNLALNARDAMPDGGTLTIETANADVSADYVVSHPGVTPGLYVCLVVSDTGVGMAPATRAHLFEPFFTTKAPGEGTGLGLATVYGITSQSGGHVTVYSELGFGASFKVYLPRVAAPLPEGAQLAAARPAGGTEVVLLVEDEDSVRSFATRVLGGLSYRLLVASNASEALDVAGAHRGRIDLLLTDVMLPGMNGRRLSEALTALRPGLRTLFVSGYTEDTVVQQGILRHGADFLGKPFTPDALAGAVRTALTRKQGPIGTASPFMPPFATQYQGPGKGPTARHLSSPIAYVASDMGNGGVAAVCAAVREAAQSMGWTLQAFDGRGSVADRAAALRQALALGSAGIILGGFDPTEHPDVVAAAAERGIPVVGWHAGTRPGPGPTVGMFTNVSTHPLDVATLAAYYAIADSNGSAGVVIYTDSQYQIALDKAEHIRAIIEQHRGCQVLDFVDTPIATAAARVPALVTAELREFGPAFTHLLAVNGNYFAGSRLAFMEAGLRGTDAPHAIAAGDGDEAEFGRIRNHDFQAASVAEPLYLQGWQLVDELNRALAGEEVSGYLAPPSLITPSNVPSGNVFDPASAYRDHYRRIWHPLAV